MISDWYLKNRRREYSINGNACKKQKQKPVDYGDVRFENEWVISTQMVMLKFKIKIHQYRWVKTILNCILLC